jgi:hypothetical protein
MPTPLEFLRQYHALRVVVAEDDQQAEVCREATRQVQLGTYFMMDWDEGTEELSDYRTTTAGSRRDSWFQENKEFIRNAGMGKGSPRDYELALQSAVRSGKVADSNQNTLQTYCNDYLGIDCSGFVTNYLIACGKKEYSAHTVRNTSAASYYQPARAVNDSNTVRQGDILVWMSGNNVMRGPGHVAVVESYIPQCVPGGNMGVVEATGNANARPKVLHSKYEVEQIISPSRSNAVMILVVKRHGQSGSRVAVMRF